MFAVMAVELLNSTRVMNESFIYTKIKECVINNSMGLVYSNDVAIWCHRKRINATKNYQRPFGIMYPSVPLQWAESLSNDTNIKDRLQMHCQLYDVRTMFNNIVLTNGKNIYKFKRSHYKCIGTYILSPCIRAFKSTVNNTIGKSTANDTIGTNNTIDKSNDTNDTTVNNTIDKSTVNDTNDTNDTISLSTIELQKMILQCIHMELK